MSKSRKTAKALAEQQKKIAKEQKENTAMLMIKDGLLSMELIAKYLNLELEEVAEIKKRMEKE